MTDHVQLAATIVRAIRADGFCVNATTLPPTLGGGVAFLAWRDDGGIVRPPGDETWEGKGPDRYRGAVALADALGWKLEE